MASEVELKAAIVKTLAHSMSRYRTVRVKKAFGRDSCRYCAVLQCLVGQA